MAIAFDTSALHTSGSGGTSTWANNFSHASIGGSSSTNLGIVVAQTSNGGSQTFEPSGTPTCDIGGTSLTWLGYVVMGAVIQAGWVGVWAGLGVPTGTQTVTFSVSSAGSAFTNGHVTSYVYTGVGSIGSLVTNQANSGSASLTVPSATGRTVFAQFSNWQPNAFSSLSFTARRTVTSATPYLVGGDQAGAASTSVTATLSAIHWGGVGFEMLEAGAGAPTNQFFTMF
jgi:hypothetical protein